MGKLYDRFGPNYNDRAYERWSAKQRREYSAIKSNISDPRIKSFEDWMRVRNVDQPSVVDTFRKTHSTARKGWSVPLSGGDPFYFASPEEQFIPKEVKKSPKPIKNKTRVGAGSVLKFAGSTLALATVAPGEGVSNLIGSVAAVGTWKGLGIRNSSFFLKLAGAAGAYTGVKIGANLFSGRDDAYNTIEGLRHGGLAGIKRKIHTDFGSGWRADAILYMKGELLADERAAAKYIPYRGSVASDAISVRQQNKELSFFGKILSEINSLGGKASKKLREASFEVNRLPFEMANNGGRRHNESAASRSYN